MLRTPTLFLLSALLLATLTSGQVPHDMSPFGNIHPLSFGEVHCGPDMSLYHNNLEDRKEVQYGFHVPPSGPSIRQNRQLSRQRPQQSRNPYGRRRSKRASPWATGRVLF